MPDTSPVNIKATDFYLFAENFGVPVEHLPLPATKSVAVPLKNKGVIGLDCTESMTRGEEQARLGHELGHCLYGGFYTRCTPYDNAERHEARADKWYILHAIPRRTLFDLLRRGYDAWEIADMLDTTEEYVRRAYYYYKDNP